MLVVKSVKVVNIAVTLTLVSKNAMELQGGSHTILCMFASVTKDLSAQLMDAQLLTRRSTMPILVLIMLSVILVICWVLEVVVTKPIKLDVQWLGGNFENCRLLLRRIYFLLLGKGVFHLCLLGLVSRCWDLGSKRFRPFASLSQWLSHG